MSILITGGAGYVGSHMVIRALDAGESVVVLDNLSTGFRQVVDERAIFIHGNVEDQELVRSLLRSYSIKEILHFAGSVIVPESVLDPLKYYRNNTASALNLLCVAVEESVERFIFSSTAAVYGEVLHEPVAEVDPKKPTSPYGWSKLMTEQMLQDLSRSAGLKFTILRYFNVAGADPLGRSGQVSPTATHLIKVACDAAAGNRDVFTIHGADYNTPDGTCVRDFIHVSDLADIHLEVLNYLRNGGNSEIFNCGYGKATSVRQVLSTICRLSGERIKVNEGRRRTGDSPYVVASPQKLHSYLSWAPKYNDLDFIISTALNWQKKMQSIDAIKAQG